MSGRYIYFVVVSGQTAKEGFTMPLNVTIKSRKHSNTSFLLSDYCLDWPKGTPCPDFIWAGVNTAVSLGYTPRPTEEVVSVQVSAIFDVVHL